MDPNTESIKCEKNGQVKFFSQHQLDMIGKSSNGTYDGWIPQAKVPDGIPEPTQLPIPPQTPIDHSTDKATKTAVADTDPNAGLVINHGSAETDTDTIPPTDQVAAPADPNAIVVVEGGEVVPPVNGDTDPNAGLGDDAKTETVKKPTDTKSKPEKVEKK